MITGFLYKRIVEPVMALIRQGISPERIFLGVACGIVLGVFPVLGSTTILSGLAAVIFRLNLPALQLVNYLVYPLQIIILMPFFHLGGLLFQVEPVPLSAQEIIALLRSDLVGTVSSFLSTTLRHCSLVAPKSADFLDLAFHARSAYKDTCFCKLRSQQIKCANAWG